MKKLLNTIWICVFLASLTISCTEEVETPTTPLELDFTSIEGNWTVTNAVYQQDSNFQDVTEYFADFKVKIDKNQSSCHINGRETWTSVSEWVCNGDYFCSLFKIDDTDYIIFFDIRSIRGADKKIMLVNMFMGYPGLSFLPKDKSSGDFRLILTTD